QWDVMSDYANEESTKEEYELQEMWRYAMWFFQRFRWFGSREEIWQSTQVAKSELHNILSSAVKFPNAFEEQTGLAMSASSALNGMRMDKNNKPRFEVHSLWPIQRVRPDGSTLKQVVGSIIQTCDIKEEDDNTFPFRGGCTLIFDLDTNKLR